MTDGAENVGKMWHESAACSTDPLGERFGNAIIVIFQAIKIKSVELAKGVFVVNGT